MRDCLPKIEKTKTVDIVSYEFYPEEWHDRKGISQNLGLPSYSIIIDCLPTIEQYRKYSSEESTWIRHTKNLMLKRCLQIWQKLNQIQIRRGLALQQRGIYSVNHFIGLLNSTKAIKKQGKGVDAPWVVMDINSLKPDRSKLLPDRGVEAAKRRAREWQKQGLFPSDKS